MCHAFHFQLVLAGLTRDHDRMSETLFFSMAQKKIQLIFQYSSTPLHCIDPTPLQLSFPI